MIGRALSRIFLIFSFKLIIPFFDGFIIKTVSWSVALFSFGLYGILRMLNPKKSIPSLMWVIFVLLSLSVSPLSFRKVTISSLISRNIVSFRFPVTIMSYAYLIKCTPELIPLRFLTRVLNPQFRLTRYYIGLVILYPPCGKGSFSGIHIIKVFHYSTL